MPIGTARMAHLCLPNSELHVGLDWDDCSDLLSALSNPLRPAMLLYPNEKALDVGAELPRGPLTLVVVDGTWSLTKKMVRQNTVLSRLPRLSFQPSSPSNYRIRREPSPHCVSTIEALALALGRLEGDPDRFMQLLTPFQWMVDRHLELRERKRTFPCRHVINKRRTLNIPEALRERQSDIVCVVGEANAWPYCAGGARRVYPDELVHWVAQRMVGGEPFEYIVAPRYPLAPNTSKHVALSPERLQAGGSVEELCARWRNFVRETDILCSWGCYATGLLASDRGFLPPLRYDLRQLAKHLLKRKLGTMDQLFACVGEEDAPNLASGRAGKRLGQLVRIARCFNEGRLRGQRLG